jgi:hypothetical protein
MGIAAIALAIALAAAIGPLRVSVEQAPRPTNFGGITEPVLPAAETPAAVERETVTQVPAQDQVQITAATRGEFGRWWNRMMANQAPFLPSLDVAGLRDVALVAWAGGATQQELRAALFSPMAERMFTAAGQRNYGKPSPYLEYFRYNPQLIAELGRFQLAHRQWVPGHGGTQAAFFAAFPGSKEAYLFAQGVTIDPMGRVVEVGSYVPMALRGGLEGAPASLGYAQALDPVIWRGASAE